VSLAPTPSPLHRASEDGGGRGSPQAGGEVRGISVIIVSYNVREILDACLQSIHHAAANFDGTVEVIVFDNASRDATVALLRPRWPGVVWISSDRNLGFGTGCNRGAKVATQELLLFLNPDTLIAADTLGVMRDFFAANPSAGVAGCKIVNRDGSLQAASKRSFPSPRVAAYKFVGLGNLFPKSRIFGRYNLTYLDENQTHEVDAVSGSFLCIRSDLYAQVGGFDEDFFMYGEDLDLCFRVKLAGRVNYYHPATTVIHFKGESAKSRPFLSFLYFHEAMIIFSRKHLELRTLPSVLLTVGVAGLALANFVSSRFLKWPRWFADLVAVNGVLALTAYVYQHSRESALLADTNPRLYFLWHVLASLSALLPLAYIGEYGRRIARPRAVFVASCIGFLGFFSLSFFMHERAFSRVVFGLTAIFSTLLLTGWRWVSNHGGKLFRRIMAGSKRVAILGTGARAQALAQLIQDEKVEGYECVGFIHFPAGPIPPTVRANVIGDIDSLASLTRKLELQGVIIVLDEGTYPAALRILAQQRSAAFEVKMLLGSPEPGQVSLVNLNFTK
jgi:GT2 family glycosyltransferase